MTVLPMSVDSLAATFVPFANSFQYLLARAHNGSNFWTCSQVMIHPMYYEVDPAKSTGDCSNVSQGLEDAFEELGQVGPYRRR